MMSVISGHDHIFKHNHEERQPGSLFGKPDAILKVLLIFNIDTIFFSESQLGKFNVQTVQSADLSP